MSGIGSQTDAAHFLFFSSRHIIQSQPGQSLNTSCKSTFIDVKIRRMVRCRIHRFYIGWPSSQEEKETGFPVGELRILMKMPAPFYDFGSISRASCSRSTFGGCARSVDANNKKEKVKVRCFFILILILL